MVTEGSVSGLVFGGGEGVEKEHWGSVPGWVRSVEELWLNHRITETLGLENTFEVIKSSL